MAHPTRHRWRGILAAALVAVAVTASADPVPTIMTITVNGQERGDHFVLRDGDRWLIADAELRQLGFQEAIGDSVTIEGTALPRTELAQASSGCRSTKPPAASISSPTRPFSGSSAST